MTGTSESHFFGDDKKEMTNRGALVEVMENKSDSSEFAYYEKKKTWT